ncbi:MAG: TRAM domain-containing protein [Acidobacteriota bacterium]|nr:TRAM domain-containing protein [Acidobacteriota bacterium]
MDLVLIRLLFVALLSAVCFFLHPFGLNGPLSAAVGAVGAGAVIVFELRVRALSLRRLIGAVAGSVLGIFGAALFCMVLRSALEPGPTSAVLQIFVLLLMSYVGLLVGTSKGELLNPALLGNLFSSERQQKRSAKLLDTSVIIDGRIADIAEAGFIDGAMVIPEFVLRELQVVADSTDGSKRQRGRRGLDMLQRMQSNARLQVQIVPDDFPSIREVDLKLLELAKKWDAKVVTNDFNLNKVAQLHHVEVLNINDLANALKPVVLPGEHMNVVILKEGKEYNQGVGYLDDGTMVVVDHARKMIGKPVEISVTSVLQTASGKMIFGKMDENGRNGDAPRPTPMELTH